MYLLSPESSDDVFGSLISYGELVLNVLNNPLLVIIFICSFFPRPIPIPTNNLSVLNNAYAFLTSFQYPEVRLIKFLVFFACAICKRSSLKRFLVEISGLSLKIGVDFLWASSRFAKPSSSITASPRCNRPRWRSCSCGKANQSGFSKLTRYPFRCFFHQFRRFFPFNNFFDEVCFPRKYISFQTFLLPYESLKRCLRFCVLLSGSSLI